MPTLQNKIILTKLKKSEYVFEKSTLEQFFNDKETTFSKSAS